MYTAFSKKRSFFFFILLNVTADGLQSVLLFIFLRDIKSAVMTQHKYFCDIECYLTLAFGFTEVKAYLI